MRDGNISQKLVENAKRQKAARQRTKQALSALLEVLPFPPKLRFWQLCKDRSKCVILWRYSSGTARESISRETKDYREMEDLPKLGKVAALFADADFTPGLLPRLEVLPFVVKVRSRLRP